MPGPQASERKRAMLCLSWSESRKYRSQLTTDNTINASKAAFASRFGSLIWFVTTGLQLFVVWWYRKSAVFWLPEGWVPGFIAWLLRWPSAPKGECRS